MYRKPNEPCFISTQRILMDLPLTINEIPKTGTGTFAKASSIVLGAGFIVLSAVARQGVKTCCASPLGTGPNSKQIKEVFRLENIECIVEEVIGDNGMNLNLRDSKGNYTYIVSSGVEAEPQLSELEDITLQANDYVFVSGMDLSNETSARVLLKWCKTIPRHVNIVFSPGPFVEKISLENIEEMLEMTDILTINKREINTIFLKDFVEKSTNKDIGDYLSGKDSINIDDDKMWSMLSEKVKDSALIVIRDGVLDCRVKEKNTDSKVVSVPCFKKPVVDTTGVADTHTGVLVASLMSNHSVYDSVRRANLAAAMCASKVGNAHCPSSMEIDILLENEL